MADSRPPRKSILAPAWMAFALLLAGNVRGEALDLRQCLDRALSQSPERIVSRSQVEQAEAALQGASGARLPRVDLSLTATRTNNPLSAFGLKLGQEQIGAADFNPVLLNDPAVINNFNTRLDVALPVYTGGLLGSQMEQARAAVQAAHAGDEAARQELIMQVAVAYDAVHAARAWLQVASEAEKAATEHVRIAQRLFEQGITVKSDVLSARAQREEARTRVTEARNGEAIALDRLRILLDLPADAPLDIGAPAEIGMAMGSEEEMRRQALSGHAGLAALRSQLAGGGAQVRAARAGRLPQLNLLMRQEWNDRNLGADAASYTVAGVLSWNAFDGGGTRSAVDRAEAERMTLAARLQLAERNLEGQVGASRRRALEADERVQARETAVDQTGEAQRLVQKRYENGLATLVELLSAQAQLDRARAELVAARHERTTRRLELKRALGILSVDQL